MVVSGLHVPPLNVHSVHPDLPGEDQVCRREAGLGAELLSVPPGVRVLHQGQQGSGHRHHVAPAPQKNTLHWHSYSDHLKEALNEMMLSSEFADVTLVTDDKQRIRAHRNILSAFSPVFKSILQIDNNNANQVIYLRGIQHSEMESIMYFIYLGEARTYEERISEFLTVSKKLEIKKLSTGIELYDQTALDQVESNENSDAAENIDIAGAPQHALHEDGDNIEP